MVIQWCLCWIMCIWYVDAVIVKFILLYRELGWWSWWWAELREGHMICEVWLYLEWHMECRKWLELAKTWNDVNGAKPDFFSTEFQCGFALSNDIETSPNLTPKYFKMFPTIFMFWPRSNSNFKMFEFANYFIVHERT